MRKLITVLIVLIVVSCNDNDGNITLEETTKTEGSENAIAVYNHAYNENYEADQIEYIALNANNAYVLLDPFQDDAIESIDEIKANRNQLAAYISIGTGENWREDFNQLQPFLTTQQWAEWPGEYFVNATTTGLIEIMKIRIDKIADLGFDWVEFDNMDWALYDDTRETYDIQVSKEESIAYYQELCNYVHEKGMKCMAKNFVENVEDFDGVTYESYQNEKNWWDYSGAQSFLNDGKLVIIIHYNESNCDQVYTDYQGIYNNDLSFICEDNISKKYIHYNQ